MGAWRNQRPFLTVRIAIDARAASHSQPGGYQTYARQLIRHLTQLDVPIEWVLYVDRAVTSSLVGNGSRSVIRVLPSRLQVIGAGWREQVLLPRALRQDHATVAHFPANTGALRAPCATVLTLHDTLLWDETASLNGLPPAQKLKRASMSLYNRSTAATAARHAARIITISEYSRRALIRRLALEPDRIVVTHLAPAQSYKPINAAAREAVLAKFGLSDRYILALSSASPRKNASGLLRAFAQVGADLLSSHQLAIVWTHGLWRAQVAQQIEQLGIRERVVFVHQPSDQELAALYSGAQAFVFPSLDEGFGLPPLEAMACGAPVIASNRASLPEVLGEGALLVDPLEPGSLATALAQVLRSSDLRDSLRLRGLNWVRRYSWERCARETLQVYAQAARTNHRPFE